MRTRLIGLFTVLAVVAASCSSEPAGDAGTPPRPSVDLSAETQPATFTVTPGVETLTVTGADPRQELTLVDADGNKLLGEIADELGQAHFALVPDEFIVVETGPATNIPTTAGTTLQPGTYTVWDETTDPPSVSEPVTVLDRDDTPPAAFFEGRDLTEHCPDFEETRFCYTYIEMRDGVLLSASIWAPDPVLYPDPGPWPTVLHYSGYGPSRPGDRPDQAGLLAWALGYTVVGINMRGTGCSGGVFDIFNPAQHADGYDAVETVARQPWVLHDHVGMVGISYSGISQLYTASTRPPSLASIAPMSVIDDPWRQQYPGGIYNDGFTRQWLAERDRQNAADGSNWVTERADAGDETCARNLELRNQSIDFETFASALEFYPRAEDDRRISLLIEDIDVPVYLTGAWQDEQTGARFATMLDRFDNVPFFRANVFNGHHPDGLSPPIATELFDFLELTVAERVPELSPLVRGFAPEVFRDLFGTDLGFAEDRWADYDSLDAAWAAYAAEDPIRVNFEFGWGDPEHPGWHVPGWVSTFAEWPPSDAVMTELFLGPDGTLVDGAPADGGTDRYRHDPEVGSRTYAPDGGAYDFANPLIEYDWRPFDEGDGVDYLSAPLERDLVLAAPGYVDLWIAPGASDTNVEVNLSEVHPDGTEFRIQSGWLRLGHQGVDPAFSDDYRVEYTYTEADFVELTPGEWINAKVPIYPFAHPLRAGSQLRLTIETPGGNTPLWTFLNPTYDGDVTHDVGWGGEHATRLVLMELPGIDLVGDRPACPSLRGQVCRAYLPVDNTPAG